MLSIGSLGVPESFQPPPTAPVGQVFSYLPFSLHRLLYWLCESMMIFPIHLRVRNMMVLLRNIFDEIVKITNFIQFWTQEYTSFKYSVMKWEVCMKHFCCILKNHGCFKKMNLCSCYSYKLLLLISWNAIFICKNEKQMCSFRFDYLAGIFSKMNLKTCQYPSN